MKIRKSSWGVKAYVYFREGSGDWLDEHNCPHRRFADDDEWQEYKEPEEMVKLYKVAYKQNSTNWIETEGFYEDAEGWGNNAFIIESSMIEVPKSSLNKG